MKFTYIKIENYKSIKSLEVTNIENSMILVGKNNTGKSSIIDALLLATGNRSINKHEFLDQNRSIDITVKIEITEDDLNHYYEKAIISKTREYDKWFNEFRDALPSYQDDTITYTVHVNPELRIRFGDGYQKDNPELKKIFPKIYHIDQSRNLDLLLNDVFTFYDKESFKLLKEDYCTFDSTKKCNLCFNCIGVINKKTPEELTLFEATRLMQYKLFNTNLSDFADKVNEHLHNNGNPYQDIRYTIGINTDELIQVHTEIRNNYREATFGPLKIMSEGTKSIYALSLLQAYTDEEDTLPCVIIMEDPEIYLHPQLQKQASEILYRLSKKNQVIFSTQSPNLIFNFSSKQIKEIVLDDDFCTTAREDVNIDRILDDLGYSANDLMNVSFVFIVEGKQDFNRLPLLLEKYYSEIYDESGNLKRISIIPVNSCTNIKTYANLKYINKLYLKDQFLMIRDSDGKNPKHLVRQLCSYYKQREGQDEGNLPRVEPKNVLILKYYSFENYFLDPKVMAKIGVINREEDFYTTMYHKYKDYLYKVPSFRRLVKNRGMQIRSPQDIKDNMELIKIYVRGHNLYDIFYGKYRHKNEQEILKKYIDVAPRDTFKDIFDAIDKFVYFENRKKEN
ncbi:MAG: ATP-binding protein [Lachnospiraceae bacterium]|nr:ATP-binding protein [Lachnospiraceae bacterium]